MIGLRSVLAVELLRLSSLPASLVQFHLPTLLTLGCGEGLIVPPHERSTPIGYRTLATASDDVSLLIYSLRYM